MADTCSETAGCKGYTSGGVMKSALTYPLVDWANPGGDCDGIYILAAVTGTGELGWHAWCEGLLVGARSSATVVQIRSASTVPALHSRLRMLQAPQPHCAVTTNAFRLQTQPATAQRWKASPSMPPKTAWVPTWPAQLAKAQLIWHACAPPHLGARCEAAPCLHAYKCNHLCIELPCPVVPLLLLDAWSPAVLHLPGIQHRWIAEEHGQ